MRNIYRVIMAVAAVIMFSASVNAAGGVPREFFVSAGEFANDFCEADPAAYEGLLGALVSSDLFDAVYAMSESETNDLTDEEFESMVDQVAAEREPQLEDTAYDSCVNVHKAVFHCVDLYRLLADEWAPEDATIEQKEFVFYNLTRTGDFFGATGICAEIDMKTEFSDGDDPVTWDTVIYYTDEGWKYLLIL